jgi:hypothetical protein
MTLIKFNIENKTKEQRKKEVLNKLHKIQSMVESDANYTEMAYHIITNASLQKKNIKVNLDNYGNYSVIDAQNKIVGGGLFNNVSSLVPGMNKPTNTNKTTKMNSKNMNNSANNNKTTKMNKNQNKQTKQTPEITSTPVGQSSSTMMSEPSIGMDQSTPQEANESHTLYENPTHSVESNTTLPSSSETDHPSSSVSLPAKETTSTKPPTSFLNTIFGKSKEPSEKTHEPNEKTPEPTEKTPEPTEGTSEQKKSGLFGLWGGKKQSKNVDDSSFPSFQTTVFNDNSEDVFMEHMKNMSNKKYLRSLTNQELKDIMKSNHMKISHNGTSYNKEQMVNKVYQFYK